MTADQYVAWLADASRSQREKLAQLQEHVATIRALFDDDHARVLREVKKRLNSPKLAADVATLVAALADRTANPRPPAPAPEPAPAAPPASAPPAAIDETGARLEAEIAADPEAQSGYLVYGDWLASRGDPRGELVTIGHALAKNPHHKAMLDAHRAHLAAHAARLLGPLADCQDLVTEQDWHMGFLRACRVAYTMDRFNDGPEVAIEDVIGWLVDDPAPARFLQKLTVGIVRHDGNSYEGVARVLARRSRPALRRLFFGDFTYEETELNWSSIGDVGALWPMLPELRVLCLRSGTMQLGPIDLPRLEALEIVTGGLDPDSARHIARATWPELAIMSLMFGPGHRGAASDVALVEPLLAGTRLPKLRYLAIKNCDFTDELATLLPHAAVLPQLEALDLSQGTLSDAGVRALAAHRDKLAHLYLVVDENFLTTPGIDLLRTLVARLESGEQRNPNRGRYAAMYE